MYAIVQSGGKQYKVSEGTMFAVDKMQAQVGDKITLDVVLISNDGAITVGKSAVEAEVVNHFKDEKVVVYKYKAKKNVRKRQGHRQPYTTLKVTAIKA